MSVEYKLTEAGQILRNDDPVADYDPETKEVTVYPDFLNYQGSIKRFLRQQDLEVKPGYTEKPGTQRSEETKTPNVEARKVADHKGEPVEENPVEEKAPEMAPGGEGPPVFSGTTYGPSTTDRPLNVETLAPEDQGKKGPRKKVLQWNEKLHIRRFIAEPGMEYLNTVPNKEYMPNPWFWDADAPCLDCDMGDKDPVFIRWVKHKYPEWFFKHYGHRVAFFDHL
jgi:hypothetical protein